MTGHPVPARVLLYWLPLGAGGRSIRWNGRVFESLVARHERRTACALYHSALEVHFGGERAVIEMAAVWAIRTADRGVVRKVRSDRAGSADPPSSATRSGAGRAE
ncbi:hypothetical protein [Cryptosporangium minutisporangium]|uniref:Uncharacterized protein n=1 Tax=Cryptosporangium minutisporangium TaxID=113569 RepID=A0ABP6SST5_9ACTN